MKRTLTSIALEMPLGTINKGATKSVTFVYIRF
jgi:hypothetical protein